MIAKISTGISTAGMVNYNHSKTKKLKENKPDAVLLSTNLIKLGSQNTNFDIITDAIKTRNSFNSKVEKPNIHISLNFHKDDILTNEAILKIGNDYMEQMGYKDQPYAVYRHYDKEHPHIHIVSSQIDISGKKINDSHLYYRSVRISRELEEKYNITKAVGKNSAYSQKVDIETKIHEHLEQGKHSLTAILNTVLIDVMDKKPTSEELLDRYLEEYQIKRNISYEDGTTIVKGHYFDLLPVDYFDKEKDNLFKNSKGIPGHELDISFSYQSISAQIELNIKEKRDKQANVMGRIYSIINPINIAFSENNKKEKLTDLTLNLRKKGIELQTKRTQTGEQLNTIYGLIFKDIKTGHSYSATDIKLKTKDFLAKIEDDLKDKPILTFQKEAKDETTRQMEDYSYQDSNDTGKTINSFIDILSAALQGGGNNENIAPKKKRKRRKR